MAAYPHDRYFPACMYRPTMIHETPGAYGTIMLRLRYSLRPHPMQYETKPTYANIIIGWLTQHDYTKAMLTIAHPVREMFAPFDGLIVDAKRPMDLLKTHLLAHATLMSGDNFVP